ncbi:hypothetical protein Tco_0375460 [Tanacetum coccineum]
MGELPLFLGFTSQEQKEDGIFISQDKYVGEILKKFGFFSIRSANTPMETHKALTKDEDGKDVDVHLYRSMIGSLMYLTSSRPDIMFSCKKQTMVANSTTEAENITASHCCGQVLWIQNQMLDYGFNFMQTKIHVDNESAICVVKNPVYHSKTKHIKIKHHFIRDSYGKRLIEMVKIHTDHNVADLLTKAFDFLTSIHGLYKNMDPHEFSHVYLVFSSKRGRDTKIPQSGGPHIKVGDEAVHKELGDIMEKRGCTNALCFEAEQDSATASKVLMKEVESLLHIDRQVKGSDFFNTEAFLKKTSKSEDNEPKGKLVGSARETSPSRITSSPSLSPQHTPVSTPSTSQPPNTQPTPDAEEAVPMPHESPLHSVHSLGRDEGSLSLSELTVLCTNLSNKVTSLEAELAQTKQTYGTALTKLIKKVKKLEQTVKSTQARRRFRIVVSDDEEGLEDPSKQGRKITEIDQDPSISLVQDEGTSWIQEDIEIQEKISDDTEVVLEEEEPTELVEDQGSGEKGEKEVSTVDAEHSTVIPEVSTAAENLVYIRRSAEKKKDKGKRIMIEPKPEKKIKKQLEQERLGHEEAIRLQEQIDEEERQRIIRDAEIAKQLQEEINKATQEQGQQKLV